MLDPESYLECQGTVFTVVSQPNMNKAPSYGLKKKISSRNNRIISSSISINVILVF